MNGLMEFVEVWNNTGWTYGKVMSIVLIVLPFVFLGIAALFETIVDSNIKKRRRRVRRNVSTAVLIEEYRKSRVQEKAR